MLIVSIFIIFLISIWIHKRQRKLNKFQRNGIPGPKPNFIWGNMLDMKSHGSIQYHKKLISEFGPVVGYYLGTIPYLVVSDKELLHEILVSNSRIFITRPRRIPGGVNPDPKRKRMLAHLPPQEWQVVRKVLTGMFNPAKLKPHISNLKRLVDVFMNTLEAEKNKSINLGSHYEFLSLDLIGQTAFGRRVQVQGNSSDPLLLAVRDKYSKPMLSPLNILSLCFPELNSIIYPMRVGWQKLKELTGFAGELNATLWEVAYQCMEDSLKPENIQNGLTSQFQLLQRAGINPELMMAYCVNAFQGDYENVTTTLMYMTHLLIDHPEVQNKIRQEVTKVRKELGILKEETNNNNNNDDQYEFYSRLRYMDSVIYETLRLWPQTSFVRRSPSEDYPFIDSRGRKLIIPKGVHIQVAHFEAQREIDVWGEDSQEFQPDRFYSGGNRNKVSPNCVTYQGFGSGVRHCMGQMFATLILKMTITSLLDKYQLERCSITGRIEDHGRSLMTPVTPFFANLKDICV